MIYLSNIHKCPKSILVIFLIFLTNTLFNCVYISNTLASSVKEMREIKHIETVGKINEIFAAGSQVNAKLEPKLEFKTLENEKISLKSLRNNFIVLYFFGSWCISCADDLKNLDKLSDELAFRDIEEIKILPIAQDAKNLEKLNAFLSSSKIKNLQVLLDTNKRAFGLLGIHSLPSVIFIDKQGKIIYKSEQAQQWNNGYYIDKLIAFKDGESLIEPNESDTEKNEFESNQSSDIIMRNKEQQTTIIN